MRNKFAKIFLLTITTILVFGLFTSASKKKSARTNEVVVYTYNSFSGEWGAGPEIARLFEQKTGIKVTYAEVGDSGQILSKAILEKKKPVVDVLVGLDNYSAEKALKSGVLIDYKPADAEKLIPAELSAKLNGGAGSKKWFLTPYDYSHFAFIFDSLSGLAAPTCLEDLTKPEYAKKIIIMDSKTSTLGVGYEEWVKAVYKDKADDFFARIRPSLLTVAPGWSVGYGMFTDGEAPLCFSYTTSPAYHVEYGEGDRFKALVFTDGHVMQVEGAGVVKGAPNPEGAKKFMDFLISDEAQNLIPLTQWMFPANKNVELPASYAAAAPVPKTIE
ncbi:MAG: thiamine ABC transporter substrate-binding protein [Treponema sp.]|nr:thiamine ABC transporter substrate-binding protein [Treponema sp.]